MRSLAASSRWFVRPVLSAPVVTLCLLVLLSSGAAHAQAPCEPPAARVVSIQGTVELKRAGTDLWTPAMLEEALCIGDALRVGEASRAALALANDSTLRLDQRTTLQLSGDAAMVPEGEAPARMIVARPREAVAWALYYPPILTELAGRRAPPRPLPPGLETAVERVADNDYAGALQALEAVPEAARDARYHTYRAGVLLNVGRVEEADAAIAEALARDPDAGAALAQRAIIHVVQNREAEA